MCCSGQNGFARQQNGSSNGPAAEAEEGLSPSPKASQKPKRQKRAPRKAPSKAVGSSPTTEAGDAQAPGNSPAVHFEQAQAPCNSPEKALVPGASPQKPKRKYVKSGKFVGKFNSWKKKQSQSVVANAGVACPAAA